MKESLICANCKLMECSQESGNFFCFNNHWDDVNKLIPADVANCPDFQSKIFLTAEQVIERDRKREERKKHSEGMESAEDIMEKVERMRKLGAFDKKEVDISINSLIEEVKSDQISQRREFIGYPYTLLEGKILFDQIYTGECEKTHSEREYTDFNKKVINILLAYFMGLPDALSPHKGIYLWGSVGRGKTLVMKSFQIFCNKIEKKLTEAKIPFTPRAFKFETCQSIVTSVKEEAKGIGLKILQPFYAGAWAFDDLGAEKDFKSYGNDENIMLMIMERREVHFKSSGLITHATANLPFSEAELTSRYDARFESRCNALFHGIYFDGDKDYRKS